MRIALITFVAVGSLAAVAGVLHAQPCIPITQTGPHPRLTATLNAGQAQVLVMPGAVGQMDTYTSCGKDGGARPNSAFAAVRFKKGKSYTVCVQGTPDCSIGCTDLEREPNSTATKLVFKSKSASVTIQLSDCKVQPAAVKKSGR
jgi:hypothetical protein